MLALRAELEQKHQRDLNKIQMEHAIRGACHADAQGDELRHQRQASFESVQQIGRDKPLQDALQGDDLVRPQEKKHQEEMAAVRAQIAQEHRKEINKMQIENDGAAKMQRLKQQMQALQAASTTFGAPKNFDAEIESLRIQVQASQSMGAQLLSKEC